jgi:GDP-D-mannose dehydratase
MLYEKITRANLANGEESQQSLAAAKPLLMFWVAAYVQEEVSYIHSGCIVNVQVLASLNLLDRVECL